MFRFQSAHLDIRHLPEVSWGLCADGHRLVFLIITLEDFFTFWGLQQSNTSGYSWTMGKKTEMGITLKVQCLGFSDI